MICVMQSLGLFFKFSTNRQRLVEAGIAEILAGNLKKIAKNHCVKHAE